MWCPNLSLYAHEIPWRSYGPMVWWTELENFEFTLYFRPIDVHVLLVVTKCLNLIQKLNIPNQQYRIRYVAKFFSNFFSCKACYKFLIDCDRK